ncbi:conserved hypothetical protein [groundwater metagenome]|uniref:AAA+ ATPase domain-containing protein n=1 Tax=groundwater metagenome TaxID=717931 RepID=A0A098E6Z9_9ZZZZ
MTINSRKIEFFNRESETAEIKNILESEPRLITFIYGPINSGKTSLIMNLIEDLPKDYVVFYINLRETVIASYKDFIETLFDTDFEEEKRKTKMKELIPDVIEGIKVLSGVPIPTEIFKKIFKEEKPKNAFKYILKIIYEVRKKGKTPVFIIDELQKIGDVKVDSYLIYDVFNFFIRLTKELHVCHVFALSSDSLFIERVYNEAILKDRCTYLLIDNFDEETTKKFLKRHNFSGKEQENVYNNIGGKPAHLLGIIDAKNRGGDVITETEAMLESRKKEIKDTMRKLKRFGSEITYNEVPYKVDYNDVISTLKMFGEKDKIFDDDIDEVTKMYLVKNNILFAECVNETIKPQSKLDLLAIREILGN